MKYGVGADFGFRPATEQEQAEAYVKEQRPALMETSRVGITAMYNYEINLQDWLSVLGEMFAIDSYGNTLLFNTKNDNYGLAGLRFNLTTGQPATEADYKAFNDIVNL